MLNLHKYSTPIFNLYFLKEKKLLRQLSSIERRWVVNYIIDVSVISCFYFYILHFNDILSKLIVSFSDILPKK